jgi:hypothetical protein
MTLNARASQKNHTSVFTQLAATPERIFVERVSRAKLLPARCGTYAFYDSAGDVLYIGKAKNVRARVLSHLRGSTRGRLLLRPWTHLIARIEVRFAPSEMEALLVEADLVRRLRPPFNRQMRSWSRYCYLVPTDDRANPLSISCQLQSWRRCFGPYRTRRQAVRIIEAVFRLAARNGHADMLDKCYGLLGGEDDSLVIDLECQCQSLATRQGDEAWARVLPQVNEVLAKAFERAVLLREARRMLGAIIVLPGSTDPRRVAVVTHGGLRFDVVGLAGRDADDFLERHQTWMAHEPDGASGALPKAIADCLCVAAREAKRYSRVCGFVPAEKVCNLSASDLIAFLRDEKAAGH